MKFSEFAELYEKLDSTPKKLEKRDILADFYSKLKDEDLYKAVVLSTGSVFSQGEEELGIAEGMVKRVIARIAGATDKEVVDSFKKTGDLGLAAERLMEKRKQKSLISKTLTVDMVFDNLRKLPEITGEGSQEKKVALIAELLSFATPKESRYIVRTTLGQMRIGVAAGIIRDALAKAYGREPKDVEHLFNMVGDFGRVAERAKSGKMSADMELFRPVRVMLADRGGDDIKAAVESFSDDGKGVTWSTPPRVEIKYDGFRVQIHKKKDKIVIFSRRMEDLTQKFPDIVQWSKESLKCDSCIVDGEAVAYDFEKDRAYPFQHLSQRIQRKYDIDKMVRDIPVQVNIFDIIYYDGENLMNKPLKERWSVLEKIVKKNKNFQLAEYVSTKDTKEAEVFYKYAVKKGQEGVVVKNINAIYQPGKRVGYWLKVKPILEPLDLVIIGAEWGEGKRSQWLSSMILAAKKGDKLVSTGRMASGFTEEQLEELTKKLKTLIIKEDGKIVEVKPRVVVEIGYEEIQASPKYGSGYAFRFPRLLRIRDPSEKGPEDADTVETIVKLYKKQRGRKK